MARPGIARKVKEISLPIIIIGGMRTTVEAGDGFGGGGFGNGGAGNGGAGNGGAGNGGAGNGGAGNQDEGAESVQGPSGPGWVIQLNGYHFHNQ